MLERVVVVARVATAVTWCLLFACLVGAWWVDGAAAILIKITSPSFRRPSVQLLLSEAVGFNMALANR